MVSFIDCRSINKIIANIVDAVIIIMLAKENLYAFTSWLGLMRVLYAWCDRL